MRDTFADTAAARRDLGFRRRSPSPRASPASGSRSGGSVETLRRRRRRGPRPARVREPPARPRGPLERLGPGRLGGRREGRGQEGLGVGEAVLPPPHRRLPQSEHQPDARIALADSYFEEGGTGNYVLAVSSYREFLTLYPQHPKSDYAQFRCAESYFEQKNTPDRDQTATDQALEEFQRLLDVYPQSTYVEQTRERSASCGRSGRVPTSRSGSSTRRPGSPGAPPSAATRRSSRSIPTSRYLTRSSSGWLNAWRTRAATQKPAPHWGGSRQSSRRARSSKRRRSSKPPSLPRASPRQPRPLPPGRPRRANQPALPSGPPPGR